MRLLDPGGVCWGKVRNAKYLSPPVLCLLPLSPSPFFFSLIALQLRDPKILGKHPGSAALLSRSPLLRRPPSFPSLHGDLWFPAQSRWPATLVFLFCFCFCGWNYFPRHKAKYQHHQSRRWIWCNHRHHKLELCLCSCVLRWLRSHGNACSVFGRSASSVLIVATNGLHAG